MVWHFPYEKFSHLLKTAWKIRTSKVSKGTWPHQQTSDGHVKRKRKLLYIWHLCFPEVEETGGNAKRQQAVLGQGKGLAVKVDNFVWHVNAVCHEGLFGKWTPCGLGAPSVFGQWERASVCYKEGCSVTQAAVAEVSYLARSELDVRLPRRTVTIKCSPCWRSCVRQMASKKLSRWKDRVGEGHPCSWKKGAVE